MAGLEEHNHLNDAQVSSIVAGLHTSFRSGITRPIAWRVGQLLQFQKMLVEKRAEFATALKRDLNKSAEQA